MTPNQAQEAIAAILQQLPYNARYEVLLSLNAAANSAGAIDEGREFEERRERWRERNKTGR